MAFELKSLPPLPQVPRMIRTESCKRCKWSSPAEAAAGPGKLECRQRPPFANSVPTQNGLVVHTCWPMVSEDWYCGHWQPKVTVS